MSRIQQVNNIVPNRLLGPSLLERLRKATEVSTDFEKDVLRLLKFAVRKLQEAGMQIDETVLIDTKKQTPDVIAALMKVTNLNNAEMKKVLDLSVEAFEQLPEVDPIDPEGLEDLSTQSHTPRGRSGRVRAKEFF